MNLKQFCALDSDGRHHLRSPFRCAEGIAATNGHVLVCVPDDGGEYPDAKDTLQNSVAKFKASQADDGRTWVDVSSIQLPEPQPCKHCNGRGHIHLWECDECDGEGEFQHGSHWYECKECDGHGHTEASPLEVGAQKTPCSRCDGTGHGFQPVSVCETLLQNRYLHMLAKLPGCRLGISSPTDAVLFTFEGGFGAVMPCRN